MCAVSHADGLRLFTSRIGAVAGYCEELRVET